MNVGLNVTSNISINVVTAFLWVQTTTITTLSRLSTNVETTLLQCDCASWEGFEFIWQINLLHKKDWSGFNNCIYYLFQTIQEFWLIKSSAINLHIWHYDVIMSYIENYTKAGKLWKIQMASSKERFFQTFILSWNKFVWFNFCLAMLNCFDCDLEMYNSYKNIFSCSLIGLFNLANTILLFYFQYLAIACFCKRYIQINNKTIIEFGPRRIWGIIQASVCVICLSLRLSAVQKLPFEMTNTRSYWL